MKIGIVIPAYNEEASILSCLTAIQAAIEQLSSSIEVLLLVVLDSCTDQTLSYIQQREVNYLITEMQCVGLARDLGIRHLIAQGVQWIACTDADSKVEPDWLQQQLNHQPADMICGIVVIDEWSHLSAHTKQKYLNLYQDQMDHQHIHGANLSFSAQAYMAVGGFAALRCHEDVELVNKFQVASYNLIWSNQVRVITSSRLEARACEGFASFLNNLEAQALTIDCDRKKASLNIFL